MRCSKDIYIYSRSVIVNVNELYSENSLFYIIIITLLLIITCLIITLAFCISIYFEFI